MNFKKIMEFEQNKYIAMLNSFDSTKGAYIEGGICFVLSVYYLEKLKYLNYDDCLLKACKTMLNDLLLYSMKNTLKRCESLDPYKTNSSIEKRVKSIVAKPKKVQCNFYGAAEYLLDEKCEYLEKGFTLPDDPYGIIILWDYRKNSSNAGHAIAYVKNDKEMFIFDPNTGLYHVEPDKSINEAFIDAAGSAIRKIVRYTYNIGIENKNGIEMDDYSTFTKIIPEDKEKGSMRLSVYDIIFD